MINKYMTSTKVISTIFSITLIALSVTIATITTPMRTDAQVCFNEGGASSGRTNCTGIGAGNLVADKCYVKVDPNGPNEGFEEIACPAVIEGSEQACLEELNSGAINQEGYEACIRSASSGTTTGFNEGGEFDCDGVSTSIEVDCSNAENPIYSYIIAIVNFISAGVGIAIVANVMIGGVQYMMSGGNPQVTQAAVKRIINALIALLAFIFMWAFFNWLIPGGIL